MGCDDCDKNSTHTKSLKQQIIVLPAGYTGIHLSTISLMMPKEKAPGAYYSPPLATSDGMIVYAKEFEGQTPPPEIDGFLRCQDDPFRFVPLWGECLMRLLGVRYNRVTGAVNISMICNHPNCSHSGKRLTVLECENCEHRLETLNDKTI